MADAIPFQVRDDATGLPVTGAAGSFTRSAWNAWTGAPRTPAPIVEVTGGYELRSTDANAVAGTATLVDMGVGRSPRFLLFSACKPDRTNQFIALLLTDNAGALWTGTGGTIAGWSGPSTPTVFKLADGVFVVRPTLGDIAADASGFLTSPVGAIPEGYALDVEPLGESPDAPLPPQPPTPVLPGQESGTLSGGDIRLLYDRFLRADVRLVANDLETDDGLETALLLSLFLDRYDETDEDPTKRRGWWADGLLTPDDRIGSRLWRIDGKRGPGTPALLREYAREATAWLIEDRVAASIDITAELVSDGYELNVAVRRPNRNDPSRFRFARAWTAQENR